MQLIVVVVVVVCEVERRSLHFLPMAKKYTMIHRETKKKISEKRAVTKKT